MGPVCGNPAGGGSLLSGATSAAAGTTWVAVAVSVGTSIGGAPAGEPDPGVVMGLDASVFCVLPNPYRNRDMI